MPRSKLNLNQSHPDVLAADPLIGAARVRAIIEARPFSNWADLERAGLDEELIHRLLNGGAELGAPGSAEPANHVPGNVGRA